MRNLLLRQALLRLRHPLNLRSPVVRPGSFPIQTADTTANAPPSLLDCEPPLWGSPIPDCPYGTLPQRSNCASALIVDSKRRAAVDEQSPRWQTAQIRAHTLAGVGRRRVPGSLHVKMHGPSHGVPGPSGRGCRCLHAPVKGSSNLTARRYFGSGLNVRHAWYTLCHADVAQW